MAVQVYPEDQDALTFRIARPEDAPALLAIYAPYVEKTAITFEYEVPSADDFRARISNTLERYPYIVAEQGGKICGYAYAGVFKARAAYVHAIETSVYVDASSRQLGVGTLLYTALENVLLEQNVFSLNACIAVPICENDPYLTCGSELFHEKRGYQLVGRFTGCAYKFGRWYDMVWMQKLQGSHAQRLMQFAQTGTSGEVPAFISFPQLDAGRVQKLLCAAAQSCSEDARSRIDSAGAVVFRWKGGSASSAGGHAESCAGAGCSMGAGASAGAGGSADAPEPYACAENLEVLMIAMKKNRWSFPKGHINQGESKEQAAAREIREETGARARILPDFCYCVASARKTDKRNVYFFLGEYSGGALRAQEEEIDETHWVSAAQAEGLISFESDKAMFRAALEEYLARKRAGAR